ncbi:MAG: hypothetical protein LBG65_03550 [Puniceicoccales bacterium]|nr:hypothetical protein [Puniceicoccales bacterium]
MTALSAKEGVSARAAEPAFTARDGNGTTPALGANSVTPRHDLPMEPAAIAAPTPQAAPLPPVPAPKPLFTVPPQPAPALESLQMEQNRPIPPDQTPAVRERLHAADSALGAGLAPFAAGLYGILLRDNPDAPAALIEQARLGLADCRLAQNDNAGAMEILAQLPRTPGVEIRLALASVPLGQGIGEAAAALEKLDFQQLSGREKPWFHVARGLVALALAESTPAGDPGVTAPRPVPAVPPQGGSPEAAPAAGPAPAGHPGAQDRFATASAEFEAASTLFSQAGEPRAMAHARMLQAMALIRSGALPADFAPPSPGAGSASATNTRNAMLSAISLARQNRNAEAAEVLRAIRKNPLASQEEKAGAALVAGYLFPPGTPESADALCDALEEAATSAQLQRLALERLAVSFVPRENAATFPAAAPSAPLVAPQAGLPPPPEASRHPRELSQATRVYDRLTAYAGTVPATLPILEEIHLVRARLMFAAGDLPRAENAASDLLERPQRSPAHEAAALRILASTALGGGHFRRAAAHLARLATLLPEGEGRLRAALASADCLYLAATGGEGDTAARAAAGSAYAAVQDRLGSPVERGNALLLRVLCALADGRIRAALRLLDSARTSAEDPSCVDAGNLLRAEWAAIEWLWRNRPDMALARLSRILENTRIPMAAHPAFHLRFLWQRARIALADGDGATAAAVADEITRVATAMTPSTGGTKAATPKAAEAPSPAAAAGGAGATDPVLAQREAVLARASLLRQRAMMLAPQGPADVPARAPLSDPESAATALLVEARSHSSMGAHDKARKVFLEAWEYCAARGGALLGEYAAEALFSAAREEMSLVGKGAPGATVAMALTSLDNFVRQYPGHRHVPSARLLQANLFRLSGNFEDAENVYEWLLVRLPDGPFRWSAEMGRADCLFAQARALAMAAPPSPPKPRQAAPASGANAADGPATPSPKEETADKRLALAESTYARLYAVSGRPPDFKAEAGFKWANAIAARALSPNKPSPPVAGVPAPRPTPHGRRHPTATAEIDFAAEADRVRWEIACALLPSPENPDAPALGANGRYWLARLLLEFAMSAKKRGDLPRAAAAWRHILDYNNGLEGTPEHRLPLATEAERELAAIETLRKPADASAKAKPSPSPAPPSRSSDDGDTENPPPSPKPN